MKTMTVDILLYVPDKPQETRVELRIPMAERVAAELTRLQDSGSAAVSMTALYNLAGAVGALNGLRGVPLRVREVEK